METQAAQQRLNNGQLILVPHKDTIRLLEIYVKRSLSLNDGTLVKKGQERKEKWVTTRLRRHSSDPSIHLADGLKVIDVGSFSGVETPTDQTETFPEESEKEAKRTKKNKKSFWKNIIDFFSQKSAEDVDEVQDSTSDASKDVQAELPSYAVPTCLPTTSVSSRKKSMRKKSSRRRFSRRRSLIKSNKFGRELVPSDIGEFEAVVSVEPTYSYYEKVSEELEKIVHEVKVNEEVKTLSDEEVINRIIVLTKEEGDAIDDKLKENPTLNNFFQRITYSSFQKLADAYLEDEATPTHSPPTVLVTAPELVKLAFTLDFTARVAKLSRQNVGHITGLGNRYLRDRFEYKQACSDHPE